MFKKNQEESEYDLKSIFVEIYKRGYKAGTTPLSFTTLSNDLPALAALPNGPVKDSVRLWFHQQFMTPLWLHLQYGGSGSPGSKALASADHLEGVMSGEAVIAYMGYRKYEQAGKDAIKADKHARFAIWMAILSLLLTLVATGVSIFPKETHDTFLSPEPDPAEQIVPLLQELVRQHQTLSSPKPMDGLPHGPQENPASSCQQHDADQQKDGDSVLIKN